MKRILYGAGIIAFVAALGFGATGAFFSDTETSTGNTFSAGAIDLKVDDTQHYDGLICRLPIGQETQTGYTWQRENADVPSAREDLIGQPCTGSWTLKDLVPTQDRFFNFTDVKPGDSGENTISLHIDNNSAYACADISNIQNNDNGTNTPEMLAGDTTATDPGAGELGQNLDFLIWNDNGAGDHAGNNIWDADEVGTHSKGAPTANQTYTLADGTGPAIPATGTSYMGIAWCAGTFTAGGPGVPPVCDGSTMGNEVQTDSYSADIGLRVVQSRNNSDFRCAPPTEEQPTIGALVVVPPETTCDVTVGTGDQTSTHSNTINGGIALASAGQTVCVDPGTYPEDVVVNKSITLDGTGGAGVTTINGQTTGQGAAVTIAANNVTLEGFSVNGAGIAALWLNTAVTGADVHDNHLTSASGQTAVTTQGQQSNDTFTNNEFTGNDAGQLAYVNGFASLGSGQESDNVDFVHNTFDGTIMPGGEVLGNESTNSNTTQNVFKSTLTSTYAIAEAWKADAIFSQNNFDGVGGIKVRNSDGSGTVSAQNNWWGAAVPVGNTAGLVDDSAKASVAYPEN